MSHPNRANDTARSRFDADVWHQTTSLSWAQEVHQDGGASAHHKKLAETHDLITGSDGKSYFHRSPLDGVYRKMALAQ